MQKPLPLSRFQSWFQRIPLLRSRSGLLFLAGTFLILLIIFRLFTREQVPTILTPPNLVSPTGSEGSIQLTLTASWPQIPATLPLYQIASYTPLQQGTAAWAEQQGLQPFGNSGRTFTNAGRTEILTISPGSQAVSYTNSSIRFSPNSIVDESVARQQLDLFLKKLNFVPTDFSVRTSYIAPDQDNPDEVQLTTNAAEAVGVTFYLTQTLNNYPVRWEAGSVEEFVFTVTNQGVSSATLPHFPLTTQTSESARTISPAKLKENIEAGNYVIIGTVGRGAERGKLSTITASEVTLEYRVSTNTQEILPFVRIAGTGQFADGQTFPTQIVAPLTQ